MNELIICLIKKVFTCRYIATMEHRDEPIIVYPHSVKKYYGRITTVQQVNGEVVIATIKHDIYTKSKTCRTRDEAEQWIREKNIENHIPIKNIIYDYGDYLEVELTQNLRAKFDREDLDVIESHTWFNLNGYANTNNDGRIQQMHNLITNHTPTDITIDHINKDPLDNRCFNLRLADKCLQAKNRGVRKDSQTGLKNIYDNINSRKYDCHITYRGQKVDTSFSYAQKHTRADALQLAIDWVNANQFAD